MSYIYPTLDSDISFNETVVGNLNYGIANVSGSNITLFINSGVVLAGGGGQGGSAGSGGLNGAHAIRIQEGAEGIIIVNDGSLLGGGGGGGGYNSTFSGSSIGGDGGAGGGGGGGGYQNNQSGGPGGNYNTAGIPGYTIGGGGGWGYSGAGDGAGSSSSDGIITVGGGSYSNSNNQNGYVYGGGAGGPILGGGGGAGWGKGNEALFGGGGGGGSGGGPPGTGVGGGGYGGWGISNVGQISSLTNSQYATLNSGPLYMAGNQPINYYIYLNSTSSFGQLFFNPGSTTAATMNFYFSSDEITNNVLNKITTLTILKNVLLGLDYSTTPPSGTYTNGSWYLSKNVVANPNDISTSFTCYDLVIVPNTGYTFTYTNGTIKDFAQVFQLTSTGQNTYTTGYKLSDGTDLGSYFACYNSLQTPGISTGYFVDDPNGSYRIFDLGRLFIPI